MRSLWWAVHGGTTIFTSSSSLLTGSGKWMERNTKWSELLGSNKKAKFSFSFRFCQFLVSSQFGWHHFVVHEYACAHMCCYVCCVEVNVSKVAQCSWWKLFGRKCKIERMSAYLFFAETQKPHYLVLWFILILKLISERKQVQFFLSESINLYSSSIAE